MQTLFSIQYYMYKEKKNDVGTYITFVKYYAFKYYLYLFFVNHNIDKL